MSRVNVAVAVADDDRGRIYEIAAACRALGLHHSATLALVGVLTGSMESDDLVKLWAVPGVLAIEGEYWVWWVLPVVAHRNPYSISIARTPGTTQSFTRSSDYHEPLKNPPTASRALRWRPSAR